MSRPTGPLGEMGRRIAEAEELLGEREAALDACRAGGEEWRERVAEKHVDWARLLVTAALRKGRAQSRQDIWWLPSGQSLSESGRSRQPRWAAAPAATGRAHIRHRGVSVIMRPPSPRPAPPVRGFASVPASHGGCPSA